MIISRMGQGEPAPTLVLSPFWVKPFSGHIQSINVKFGFKNLDLVLGWNIHHN
jgi:hypothetical protein